ncbi:hypothetical protein K438DRAFT_1851679 [Mycena galopus ATCC 62051]|nr:hypothetical protein K438DRAFT_1851657 [Mycena galopus ATCC 62051]KAF8172170.1 hypothetical protein K438DRAFT_1851679 [Mycena galopus ATCC 62051]
MREISSVCLFFPLSSALHLSIFVNTCSGFSSRFTVLDELCKRNSNSNATSFYEQYHEDDKQLLPPIPVACASHCRPCRQPPVARVSAGGLTLVAHALAERIHPCTYAMLATPPQLVATVVSFTSAILQRNRHRRPRSCPLNSQCLSSARRRRARHLDCSAPCSAAQLLQAHAFSASASIAARFLNKPSALTTHIACAFAAPLARHLYTPLSGPT